VSGWLEAGPRHPERVVGSSSPGPEGGMVENGGCGVAFSAAVGRSSVCLVGDAERAS
jgi:hypothetical protein